MINAFSQIPQSLKRLKKPPKQLFYQGNLNLLEKKKIAIVGTRRPNPYSKLLTQALAQLIGKNGGVVVSGGALGIDILAHSASFPQTLMVAPTDLSHFYPSTNQAMIQKIYQNALAISEYKDNPSPRPYHFLERNRIVIALSDAVVIPQADLSSGSMESAKIALELKIPLYVFPQRIGESEGTNHLLSQKKALGIYDLNQWIKDWFGTLISPSDEILDFCSTMPSLEDAYARFGQKIYEYELEGKIGRKDGKFYVC